MPHRLNCVPRASGFTLIENVVALAVVTTGLLGTTRLFGEALRCVRENHQRHTAILLAEELIDILSVLHTGARPGRTECAVVTETCFTDALAQAHIARWRAALLRTLPEATATLEVTGSTTTHKIQLRIEWPDGRSGSVAQMLERAVRR